MTKTITLEQLRSAVSGDYAAIRVTTRLEPAGGPGDKVFPPTYLKERNAQTRYAMEERVVDGRRVQTVLLDSVASQANRMEEALLEGYRRGELAFPVVQVDFREVPDLGDLDRITSLTAPHRIADALLRDSLAADGTPFRQTTAGKEFTDSRPNHATGMYKHCPTALVFGCWDSTGPKGGLGAKFQRALVSEIVGFDVVPGVKTASRIDPAGIQKNVGTVFESKKDKDDWTTIESEAVMEKGKPKPFSRKGGDGKGDKGTPAVINHGNIPPSIDAEAGGVTMSHATQTTVLSLAALRRLRFQTTVGGQRITDDKRDAAETSARTALAALALAAIVYQRENDFDLRSRSLLVAKNPLLFELIGRNGEPPVELTLDRQEAAKLLDQAARAAHEHGLGWAKEPLDLRPAPKLAKLIQVSRTQVALGEAEENG